MSDKAPANRPLVAGNWKMNGLKGALEEALKVRDGMAGEDVDVLICPPATLLMVMAEVTRGSRLMIGAQDCHAAACGPHTGDISAEMVADAGGRAVIVGHSERRAEHGERDSMVRAKVEAAHRAGLMAIVCIGETAGERALGLTLDVIERQLKGSLPDRATPADTVVAYEPVWAIGSGLTPTPGDVAEVHGAVRRALIGRYGEDGRAMRILYGGSVKPSNAKALLGATDVDGALVGGASLEAESFLAIVAACRR